MDQRIIDYILRISHEGLLISLIVSGPPIVLSMMIGLTISLFQAVTQIQEQSITFVFKMIAIFGVLAAIGPWLGSTLLRFTQSCFEDFPKILF